MLTQRRRACPPIARFWPQKCHLARLDVSRQEVSPTRLDAHLPFAAAAAAAAAVGKRLLREDC